MNFPKGNVVEETGPVKIICPECGSDDIAWDAVARWDTEEQTLVLSGTFDSGRCETCEYETKYAFEETPLTTEEIKELECLPANTPERIITHMDPTEFKRQREALSRAIDREYASGDEDPELLEGLRNLLDHIADVAHDLYGMDTLLTEGDTDQ